MSGKRTLKRASYAGAVAMTIAPAEPYTLIEVKVLLTNAADPLVTDRFTIKSKNSYNDEFDEIHSADGSAGWSLGTSSKLTWTFRFEKPMFGGNSVLVAYPNTGAHCGAIVVEATWNTDELYTDDDAS